MALLMQICGAATVCFLSLIMGITYTWPSSTLELFRSNKTVLSHVMEPYEVALFGSLSSIGALVGTPLAGYLLDKIGRKYSSLIGGIPFLIGWSLVAAFNHVEVILASQMLVGLGGASFVISPVFSSEICQDSIRGTEAAISIGFYRSMKPDSKQVLEELANIKRLINPEAVESPEEEKLKPEKVQPARKEKMTPIKFLWKNQPARRALMICLIMVTASVFMGLVVVQVYAESLFSEAVPNMSPTLCIWVDWTRLKQNKYLVNGYEESEECKGRTKRTTGPNT
ncbi:Galactose-proton symporter [Eumeta japonica]|uniref:Galactose-proton symporter n=1 Tax=Eumeta variegata TaxID=151549 RepID=A0A4C1XFJ6_EUMVA|nr:Galactose-proton symporter [Eumeta japonica]